MLKSPLSIVYISIYLSVRELSHLVWATRSWHGRTKFLDLLWSPSTIHCNQPFPPPSQLFSLATQFTSEGLVSHTAQWWLLSQFCCLNIVIGLFLKIASIPFLKRSSIDPVYACIIYFQRYWGSLHNCWSLSGHLGSLQSRAAGAYGCLFGPSYYCG